MSKGDKDFYQVSLIIAVALIVGLIWYIVDRPNNQGYAPCAKDYIKEHGDSDCINYQQDKELEEDMNDWGRVR